MGAFNKDTSIGEILEKMNRSGGNTEIIHAGPCFLEYKLHQELLQEQDKLHKELLSEQRNFQEKQLKYSQLLVCATWALVMGTIILALLKK